MIRNDEREICETHKRAWIFFLLACTLSVTVGCSHCGWLLLKCFAISIRFNAVETNCGIAQILGIPDEQFRTLDISSDKNLRSLSSLSYNNIIPSDNRHLIMPPILNSS